MLVLALAFAGDNSEAPRLYPEKERLAYQAVLESHPFSNRPRRTPEEWKQVPKYDRPDLGWEQDFLLTKDPALGYPTRENLLTVLANLNNGPSVNMAGLPGSTLTPWVERGPNNVAGRTRAIMYDPNDTTNKKVYAGGVTGGLWFNNDITSSTSSWNAVDDFWDNIAVTSMAYDPNNTNTWYVGTGEGWGTGSSRGAGVWKTTDGGTTWNQLTATAMYYYVNDLMVRNENGTSALYVAVSEHFYQGQFQGPAQGLYRSTDGGTTFTQVLPNVPSTSQPFAPADIEFGANNRIWVGTRRNSFGSGGGNILYSDDGTNWTTAHTVSGARRMELATAPSDSNYIYALVEAGNVLDDVLQSTDMGNTWNSRTEPDDIDQGIPSTDFTRGQAWYDLILEVDPNNRDNLIAGGIDLFRSTDGANTWDQISKWSNNNLLSTLSVSFVHADQHAVVFKPGSSSEVLIGNDGGVYYTNNVANGATSSVFSARNNDYNVTQFYACAIHPTANNDFFLAGSQDNGTQRFNTTGINSTTEVFGGDGAYCFIDQTDPTFQIVSYVYNTYQLSTNGGTSFNVSLQDDQTTGSFINPADYDDNQDILYSGRNTSSINRIEDVTGTHSVGSVTINGMSSNATHFRVSPHTTNSTTLFLGTSNGTIFKVTNADGGSPTVADITGVNLPAASVSCIEIGGSEDSLIATFFNYGVTSVWYTTDGGTSWVSKEGNLPDMPVRWALFNPNDHNEVILATELGVWGTTNFNSSSPNWAASSNGLANVRVDQLQVRTSDNEVIAATYGRGLFSSDGFNSVQSGNAPVAAFTGAPTTICAGDSVAFTDQSTNNPTMWSWTFTGATSVSSMVQNPTIVYPTSGTFDVKLVVSNGSGSDSITMSGFITVNALPNVTFSPMADVCVNAGMQTLTGGSPTGGTYSGTGVSGGMFNPAAVGAGTHSIMYEFTDSNGCTNSATQTIVVHALPSVTFSTLSDVCENDAAFALSGGSPAGGTYSGTGVSGGMFDPAVAGTGNHVLTYTYSDSLGCSASANSTINVIALPTASLAAFNSICEDSTPFGLSGGTPSGGTYSGTGVSGGVFNPAVAGAGTHTITYTVTTGPGCADSATSNITVNPLPTVTFGALGDVCQASPAFALTGGSPTGGTYSGIGVSLGMFDPGATGPGMFPITYTYTDSNGCSNTANQIQTVLDSITITLNPLADICENDSAVILTGGNPLGGVFSGTGVSNGQFDPAVAGAGTHQVTYNYNGGPGCMGADSQMIVVNPIPTVTLDPLDSACAGGNPVTLSGGMPTGGTYSGPGVLGSQFDPVVTGIGSFPITYSFTDANGCSSSAMQSIDVQTLTVSIIGLDPDQCENGTVTTLVGNPSGGTFSGNGVTGTNFDPVSAGLGGHTITYNYNIAGCVDDTMQSITVHPAPVTSMINGPAVAQPNQTYFYNVTANNGSSYSWGVNGGTLVSSTANVASVMWGSGPHWHGFRV